METASNCHSPSTPLSRCVPRSSNIRSEPTTQVLHRARDEDLSLARLGHDPGRQVHGHPADVVPAQFHLSCVDARTDAEPDLAQALTEGHREADGTQLLRERFPRREDIERQGVGAT